MRLRGIWTILAVAVSATASAAWAQQQTTPQIGCVFPTGGQQGTTFDVTVAGRFLDGVDTARVRGGGVTATVLEHIKPLNQKQFQDLRDKVQELMKIQPKDDATVKQIQEIRKKLLTFRRNTNPALAELVSVRIAIAPDAEPGLRELRLVTPNGVSNPRNFCVGRLPEFTHRHAENTELPGDFFNRNQPPGAAASQMDVQLPAVINGQVLPGGSNRYRFAVAKGQHLVFAVAARDLIPYLADAVPGWFQAAITLYDSAGHELASADHFRFRPDPVIYYEVPADDAYVLEIHDTIYRGREDFVYRITAGEVPFVTGVFPLGIRAGSEATVRLTGWNLPATSLVKDARGKPPGLYHLVMPKGQWLSNHVPFMVDDLPECAAVGGSNSPETSQPQPITLPVIVNGRVEKPGEWSVFRIQGKAGEEIVAEVYARRLDSPLDSVLKLIDAAGKQLAFNDDHEDKAFGLVTHHADSYLRVALPADGVYYLHLGDAQRQGGAEYGYRLRVSAPRPGFELRACPSAINVRGVASVPLTVYAIRRDGFAGEIELSLKDGPPGVTLTGGRIPAGADQVTATLTPSAASPRNTFGLAIEGRAKIDGKLVTQLACPADDMTQAFAWHHLVCRMEMDLAVAGRGGQRGAARVLSATPVRIPAGGAAKVLVSVPGNVNLGQAQFELDNPPDGITIADVVHGAAESEIVLKADPAKVKPGLKGNLIVTIFWTVTPKPAAPTVPPTPPTSPAAAAAPTTAPATPPKPNVNQRRFSPGVLPAIPFEIVGL